MASTDIIQENMEKEVTNNRLGAIWRSYTGMEVT